VSTQDFEDDLVHGSAADAGAAGEEADGMGQQGDAQWMEILQQCQREVSGSLDDVAGLR
jgi:hypothetical protein